MTRPADPRPVLVAGCLSAFTATLDNTVVTVALRDMQRDLGAGVTGLQGVVTAYTVALAALLLSGGVLADVAGARRVLLSGLAGFAAASAGCALSGSVGALVLARLVQGCAGALVLPAGLALIAAAYPEPVRRGRAIALWAATGSLALVAGPLVGGVVIAAAGWPGVFWINLPLCAVAALLLGDRRTPSAVTTGRRLDLPGQGAAAVTLGASTYAVVLAGRDGPGPPVLLCLGLAVAAGALWGVIQRRATDPLIPRAAAREPQLIAAMIGAFAASLAVFALLVFVSLFLQLIQDRDALGTAWQLLPLTAALVLTAPVAVRIAARSGPRPPVLAGLLLAAGALAALGQALQPDLSAGRLGVLLAVTGVGAGLTSAPVVVASLQALAADRSGLAAGLVSVARELGGVVAVAGLGALVVARLDADLTARLTGLGVPAGPAGAVVETVLRGGSQNDVVRATDGQAGLGVLVQLRAAAEASYVSSTRVALLAAAVLVLVAAASAWWTSRPV